MADNHQNPMRREVYFTPGPEDTVLSMSEVLAYFAQHNTLQPTTYIGFDQKPTNLKSAIPPTDALLTKKS